MDIHTKERYRRWVKQKIRRRIGFMLIILWLLVNTILMFALFFNRGTCECPDGSYHLDSEANSIEAEDENEEREDLTQNANVIPGRYAFLTFDDGPTAYTQKILDVLYERNAPAIFFVIGDHITGRTDSSQLLNRMLEEGHYIGLHTMTHDHTTLYIGEGAPLRFVNEMFELNQLIYSITGGFSTDLCRAAYGSSGTFTPEHHIAVDNAGLYCIDWNIDSRDWQQRTAYMVFYNVTSQIERLNFPDELVILFHEYLWTIEALPEIIDYLRYHGYTIVEYTPGDHLTYYRTIN